MVSLSSFAGQVFGSVVANLEHFEDQPDRETPLFVGRVVAAPAADVDVMRHSGRWLVAAEPAEDYGVVDEHGSLPHSNRRRLLGSDEPET